MKVAELLEAENMTNIPFELYKTQTTVVVSREEFLDVVCDALTLYKYVGPNQRVDLLLACSKYWDRNSKYWPPSDVYLFAVILIETSEETMVATWDAYRVRVFCDICMEEVNNNNRDGGCLSKKGYENLERKFYEKVGEKLVRKQFKNKWDQLKKEYTWWMELLNATGLGWDPQTKTMDADDDWWKIHLEMRPDHAKFRNGPPPNLEQQDVMFRKAHVTGESAAIAGQETGGGKEAPILLEDDHGTSSKITGKRKFGAGEGNEKESPFFTVYNNALNTLVSRNEGSSSTKADKVPTMKEFLATVRECGVSEGTDIMFTSKLAMNRIQERCLQHLQQMREARLAAAYILR
ncbi:hypothetical protein ZWY2020_000850 [Hordeum vulgare]|nr:hypothetical protein ZWY2020_000850 [Hordeum vulgare]